MFGHLLDGLDAHLPAVADERLRADWLRQDLPAAAMAACAELRLMASATLSHCPRRSATSCRAASPGATAPAGRKPASWRTRAVVGVWKKELRKTVRSAPQGA